MRGPVVLIAPLATCLLVNSVSAEEWAVDPAIPAGEFQSKFDQYVARKFRPVNICGYTIEGKLHYAALWRPSTGRSSQVRHGLTSEKFQQTFDQLAAEKYELVYHSGYEFSGHLYHAGIWEKPKKRHAWAARHNLSAKAYQENFDKYKGEGYRLIDVRGYSRGDKPYFAAIWEKSGGPAYFTHHQMTFETFSTHDAKQKADGFRLVRLSGYTAEGTPHFAAIWHKKQGPAQKTNVNMPVHEFDSRLQENRDAGFQLVDFSVYSTKSVGPLFTTIWEME
jgi:hypothetical protein